MSNRLREIYITLLKRVKADDIIFELHAPKASTNGLFYLLYLKSQTLPKIELFRAAAPDPAELTESGIIKIVDAAGADIEHEIVTLAHEYGHYESWRAGHRSAGYVVVADRFRDGDTLDLSASRLICEEEARAWDHAQNVLNELDYPNKTYLQRRRAVAKIEYQRRLPNLDKPVFPSAAHPDPIK